MMLTERPGIADQAHPDRVPAGRDPSDLIVAPTASRSAKVGSLDADSGIGEPATGAVRDGASQDSCLSMQRQCGNREEKPTSGEGAGRTKNGLTRPPSQYAGRGWGGRRHFAESRSTDHRRERLN
jgi:hypothetical protein